MTSTIVDPSLFGSAVTSVSTGFAPNISEKSRLSHNGDDPGGGMVGDGNEANPNSFNGAGISPLSLAIFTQSLEIATYLVVLSKMDYRY